MLARMRTRIDYLLVKMAERSSAGTDFRFGAELAAPQILIFNTPVHVGGKDAQQTPSARGVSRWSARSGRHVVLCPELDAETNASPSPLLQGAASGVHTVHSESMSDYV